MEVQQELRHHLEDAAAEFHAAGFEQAAAQAEAVKRLGDVKELADDLWRANRRRLRLRNVFKRVMELTLLPAALVVTFWAAGRLPLVQDLDRDDYSSRELAGLTEEQRFMLTGDPNAPTDFERAASIVERWPDNPLYYGDYANFALVEFHERMKAGEDDAARQWYLSILDRGKRVDPENGYYHVLTAAALAGQAVVSIEDDGPTYYYDTVAVDGTRRPFEQQAYTVKVADALLLERAIAELRAGLAKPRLTTHALELAERRLELLPLPRTLVEQVARVARVVGTFLPELGEYRKLAAMLTGKAVVLAQQGRTEEALKLLADVRELGFTIGADSEVLIELLVGQSIAVMGAGHEIAVYELAGQPASAKRMRDAASELVDAAAAIRRDWHGVRTEHDRRTASLHDIIAQSSLPGYQWNPEPMRTAEQAAVQRIGLTALLMLMDGLALGAVLLGAIFAWHTRSPLLWIGWRRMGRIYLLALIVPIGVYLLYILSPLANRHFGFSYMPERYGLEGLALAMIIVVMFEYQTRQAIGRRLCELGQSPPQWNRLYRASVRAGGVALTLAVAGYIAAWQFEAVRPRALDNRWIEHMDWQWAFGLVSDEPLRVAGAVLFITLGAVCGLWLSLRLIAAIRLVVRDRWLTGTLARSSAPVLAAAVVVLGLTGRTTLTEWEAAALSKFDQPNRILVFREIEDSNYRFLRQKHRDALQRYDAAGKAARRMRT